MNAKALPIPTVSPVLGVAWAVILAFLFILAVDSYVERPGDVGDSAIYLYVGQGILQGEIPYLDRWDNKGPLLYGINALGLVIDRLWGIWAIQTFFLLGTVFLAFTVLWRVFGLLPALCALAVLLLYYGRFEPPGNYTEQFNLLFQFLAFYIFVRSEGTAKSAHTQSSFALQHVGIGALGAAAFLLRPNLVALWLVIGLYWLLTRDGSLRKIVWATVGGGGILAVSAGLFLALGAWGALWDAVFVFNFAHGTAPLLEKLKVMASLFVLMFPVVLLALAGWCLGIIKLYRKQLENRRIRSLVLIGSLLLPVEVVSLSLSGFRYPHYFTTALPALTILLAFALWFVLEQRLVAPAALSLSLLLAAAYYISPSSNIPPLVAKYGNGIPPSGINGFPEAVRLRNFIQQTTAPSDPILVWGKGAWVYLDSERNAASRYFYEVPLTMPNYTNKALLAEFLSDVEQQEPRFIIQMRKSRVPPMASDARAAWRPHPRFVYEPQNFQPFFDFVAKHYVIIDQTPFFVIYALRRNEYKNPEFSPDTLIVRSIFDVYLDGKTLIYVKSPCAQEDVANRFILHVIPVDSSVIDGRAHDTLDFNFLEGDEWHVGEGCVVSRYLPEYPIAAIRTGQFNAARTGHDWLSEYSLPSSE